MPRNPSAQREPQTMEFFLKRGSAMTPEEVATLLNVEVATTDTWASKGGGPAFIKVGRARRYWPAAVKEWLGPEFAATGKPRAAA